MNMDSLNFRELYESIPPAYRWPADLCLATIFTTWVISLITSNVSQVDRLWNFLPVIYIAYYALMPWWPQEPLFFLFPHTPKELGWATCRDFSPRAVMILGLAVIWMVRLGYNTHRRDLFKFSEEDYRWAVLRTKVPAWLFQVINLTFIATIQNVLLLSLGYPAKIASTMQPHTPLATSDYLLAALALASQVVEFTADNQQWAFHQYKHAYLAGQHGGKTLEGNKVELYDKRKQWLGARLDFVPEDAKRGFITRGLWAYSRHPNFFCEQAFWWILTLIPYASPSPPNLPTRSFPIHFLPSFSDAVDNFPGAFTPFINDILQALLLLTPSLALSLLFYSSTLFTESISKGKYPREYAAYQERVGMFSPLQTLEKGLLLTLKKRRREVDNIVWGSGAKED